VGFVAEVSIDASIAGMPRSFTLSPAMIVFWAVLQPKQTFISCKKFEGCLSYRLSVIPFF
jgi:hypothetical protein